MTTNEQRFRNNLLDFAAGQRIRAWQESLDKSFPRAARRGRNLTYTGNECISDAVYRQDSIFLEGIYDDCIGISKLKRTDSFALLKEVEADHVDSVIEKLIENKSSQFKENKFFKFHSRDGRVYFLNPAHVAKTPRMIAALGSLKVDFNSPDSEGRLPLFFIARYARSRWAIPTLCQVFNVSANDSGALPKYIPIPPILQDEEQVHIPSGMEKKLTQLESTQNKVSQDLDKPAPAIWDPPLIRAIKYRNREALLGFNLLPGGAVDWNARFQWNHMTPLIYAVIRADEIVQSHQLWHEEVSKKAGVWDWPKQDYSAWDVAKALWMVKFLAAHPRVQPALQDTTGADAKGYAYTEPVRRALTEGINARTALQKLFTTYPTRRFT